MYYTEKVLRYRVYTQDKTTYAKEKDIWSLYYSSNDFSDAEEIKSEFNNDKLRIAKVVDWGKETNIQRLAML